MEGKAVALQGRTKLFVKQKKKENEESLQRKGTLEGRGKKKPHQPDHEPKEATSLDGMDSETKKRG